MKLRIILISLVFILGALSCQKFLDKKPLKSLYVPKTLMDLQAVLDNNQIMNQSGPALLELVADNYYVTPTSYESVGGEESPNYIFNSQAKHYGSWSQPYVGPIYYSNVVLGVLPDIEITSSNREQYENIKGSALFHRAFAFYELAQLYCRPYTSTAETDEGIVLRTSSAIETPSGRATVQETYDRIINDLKESARLLPRSTQFPTRPNIAAAYGLLARTYLSMRDYENAGLYADSSLQENKVLIDYNTLPASNNPMPLYTENPEISFYSKLVSTSLTAQTIGIIDTTLYASYNANDLRLTRFFRFRSSQWRFKGSYADFAWHVFTGITTAEMYLIRAETSARAGLKDDALDDLNTLMQNRWNNTVPFPQFSASTAGEALNLILTERRKELIYRGQRWTDIRRLNVENADIAITREINGEIFTLPANDLRWVLLIPDAEINKSGIKQNPR
jgi:starch-binding outer membrane protein, SusD/RagB family